MDDTFIQARIDSLTAKVIVYEAALEALATGAESYTINTSQTTQSVRKSDLAKIGERLEWLYGQIEFWEGRLSTNPGGSIIVRPFA